MPNFTPNQNDYNNMTPFKTWLKYQINTWGLNSFPFVESDFDDLTNYAMMMKLMKHFNTLIENQNMVEEDITNLYNAFTELQTYILEQISDVNENFENLQDYVNNYFDNLDVQNEINNKLDEMVESGELPQMVLDALVNKLDDFSNSNSATIGNELITDSSLWDLNDGWITTGTDGFSHIVGQSSNLEYNNNFDANKFYILEFDVTTSIGQGENASCALTCQIGTSYLPILYRGGGSYHYRIGIYTPTSGILKFIPCSPSDQHTSSDIFNGTLSNISLKEVTGSIEQLKIYDSDENTGLAFTISKETNKNITLGNNAMIKNVTGDGNVFIGDESGRDNIGGFYNIGVGYHTLAYNVQGSRNIAIGFNALQNNISADRNIAIGSFCMNDNTDARKNVAIGFDTLQHLTSGSDNMAIGNQALGTATSSSHNMAIGHMAMSVGNPTGTYNLAIGELSTAKITSGSANIGIGRNSNYKLTTGINNVAIGNSSLANNETGGRTIAIGTSCLSNFTSGDFNIAIGTNNSTDLTTLNYGILVGCGNTVNLAELNHSILVGNNITGSSTHKNFSDVVIINSGNETVNCINDHRTIISKSIFIDTSSSSLKKVGIQIESPSARLHLGQSTSDAGSAPLKFTAGSLMTTPENGAFEYDGTHLYFTIGSTRHEIV